MPGYIKQEVLDNQLTKNQNELAMINKFLELFNITWGATRTRFGGELSTYFLEPLEHTNETFGFEKEILLVYSPFEDFQARTIQAVEQLFAELPYKGRVETLCYVLIADDENIESKIGDYINTSQESRIIIPFSYTEITKAKEWFVRNRFADNLYIRDLFDVKQPLRDETFYFGRKKIVRDLMEKLSNGENIGLFGLRKTGKTSTIYQIKNLFEREKKGIGVKIDAQSPAIYLKKWWELLNIIIIEILKIIDFELPSSILDNYNENNAAEKFCSSLNYILDHTKGFNSKILVIIDEIEHISPNLSLNKRWDDDFLPFWQTLRAFQSSETRISFMVVGVNAQPVEKPSINGVDNPLFSLVNQFYMPGLERSEVRDMVRTLGRYMGIKYDEDVYEYLKERYGGHPLLIRLACSYYHKEAKEKGDKRPIKISTAKLQDTEDGRDLSLYYYGLHIIEVLKQFYKDEFDMLGLLAQGYTNDFIEIAQAAPEYREHLIKYGLISNDLFPRITIYCIKKSLYNDAMKKKKSNTALESFEQKEINKGLERLRDELSEKIIKIKSRIISKVENINKISQVKRLNPLWIVTGRDAEIATDFLGLELCKKSSDFNNFTSYLKQLIWEKADKGEIQKNYPELFEQCVLLNGFRNYYQHLELNESAANNAEEAFKEYCDGKLPSSSNEWAKLHIRLLEDFVDTLNVTLSAVT